MIIINNVQLNLFQEWVSQILEKILTHNIDENQFHTITFMINITTGKKLYSVLLLQVVTE